MKWSPNKKKKKDRVEAVRRRWIEAIDALHTAGLSADALAEAIAELKPKDEDYFRGNPAHDAVESRRIAWAVRHMVGILESSMPYDARR